MSLWVARFLTRATVRHGRAFWLAVAVGVGSLGAQPASITTSAAPVFGQAVFDSVGNLYSFEFGPVTAGAAQTANGGGVCLTSNGFFSVPGPCFDAYVGKVDGAGNRVFGTYLGGATADQSTALAVDGAGNIFVTGSTGGSFPTTANAAIGASTTAKAFAAKVSPDGSRILYATYLPDTMPAASAIAVDAEGNAYIGGRTGTGHGCVVKLNADGAAVLYAASLGGTQQDAVDSIRLDAGGNLIVAGRTTSPDFPVSRGALQSRWKGGQEVFVAKLDSAGRVVWSTYLGGSGTDVPSSVQVDAAGNVYVAGQTSSMDFPTTAGSFEPTPVVALWNNMSAGGFAASLKADGTALAWSTYIMSTEHYPQMGVTHLGVTAAGETYVAGLTGAGFPVTASAPQICFDGSTHNTFVAHLDSHGALVEATYAGRDGYSVRGMALAGDGSVSLLTVSTTDVTAVRSQIRFGGAGWSAAACVSTSILNSATMSGGPVVALGELITLTGFGMGPETGVAYQADAQGRAPRELGGVQVLFDGEPAPVLYAQSRQINAVAPVELSGRTQTQIAVLYKQAALGTVPATVAAYGLPGIFRLQQGVNSQASALNQDGTLNSPSNPAARGSVVTVWGTGFGLLDPTCATGGLNPPGPVNLAGGLTVLIAEGTPPGVPVVYAPARYSGSAPTLLCGVVQINLDVASSALPGTYQIFPWSGLRGPGGDMSVVQGTIGVTLSVK